MTLFVPGSILLNSPANARLLPRQRRRLQQMAVGSWVLVTAGVTAAMGQWAALPVVGISLIGLALTRAGRTEAAPLFLVGINWQTLSRHVLPSAIVDAAGSKAGLVTLSVLLLPMGVWALRTLYPAAAGRLLMHALGPLAHWSAWIAGMGGMLLFGAAVRLLLGWRGGDALREFIGGPMGAGLAALTSQAAMMGLLGDFAGEGRWHVPLALQAGLLAVFELALAWAWRRPAEPISGPGWRPSPSPPAPGSCSAAGARCWPRRRPSRPGGSAEPAGPST